MSAVQHASAVTFDGEAIEVITYDPERVQIIGWEYSANGWDGPHFSPEPITHKVAWKRPRFGPIDGYR